MKQSCERCISYQERQQAMEITRRNALAVAGSSLLTAGALSLPAEADQGVGGDVLYGHGMVWNRELEGLPAN